MPSLFARFLEAVLGPSGPTPSPDDRITESGYQFAETAGAPVEPDPAFVSLATYADRIRPDLTPADYLGTRTSCDAHRWIGHGQCPNCRVEAERRQRLQADTLAADIRWRLGVADFAKLKPTSVLDLIPPTEPKPGYIRMADWSYHHPGGGPLSTYAGEAERLATQPVTDRMRVAARAIDEAKRRVVSVPANADINARAAASWGGDDPSGEYTATHRPAHGGYPDTTPRPVPERSPSVDAVLEQARHANGRRITGMVIDEEVPDPGAGEQQGMYHAGVQKAIQQRQNDDRAKALRGLLNDAAQLLEAWAAHGRPPSPTTLRRLAKAMRYASIPNESP